MKKFTFLACFLCLATFASSIKLDLEWGNHGAIWWYKNYGADSNTTKYIMIKTGKDTNVSIRFYLSYNHLYNYYPNNKNSIFREYIYYKIDSNGKEKKYGQTLYFVPDSIDHPFLDTSYSSVKPQYYYAIRGIPISYTPKYINYIDSIRKASPSDAYNEWVFINGKTPRVNLNYPLGDYLFLKQDTIIYPGTDVCMVRKVLCSHYGPSINDRDTVDYIGRFGSMSFAIPFLEPYPNYKSGYYLYKYYDLQLGTIDLSGAKKHYESYKKCTSVNSIESTNKPNQSNLRLRVNKYNNQLNFFGLEDKTLKSCTIFDVNGKLLQSVDTVYTNMIELNSNCLNSNILIVKFNVDGVLINKLVIGE